MLRMELEVQQARALEWNGVHSWVTSVFQWCSKRRINPPNSLRKKKKIQPEACDGDSYKTTGRRQRHWRLTHIQYARKSNHKSTPDIVNSRKYTSNCHATSNNIFSHSQDGAENRRRVTLRTVTLSFVKFVFQGDIPYLRGRGSPCNVLDRQGACWYKYQQSQELLFASCKDQTCKDKWPSLMLSRSPCAKRGQFKVKRTSAHQPPPSCIYKVKLLLSWET